MRSQNRSILLPLGLVASLIVGGIQSSSASVRCEKEFTPKGVAHPDYLLDVKVFPRGLKGSRDGDKHIMIAYESEYTMEEVAPLLRDYIPDPSDVPTAVWDAKTDAERVAWLKAKFINKPEFATSAGLKKRAGLPDYMPAELIVDSTGNAEIVLPPFDTLGSWNSAIDWIVARYGVGSQQAMMSKPREAAFNPYDGKSEMQIQDEHLGWLIFENLSGMFAKLEKGWERYLKNPKSLVTKSFDHAFLGPMTKLKRVKMEQFLEDNAEGIKLGKEATLFVRKSDASFKYTSGPSYRPDIATTTRFSWENRDAHKDTDALKDDVHRQIVAHSTGLGDYAMFVHVSPFDTEKEFKKLKPRVQEMLKQVFPSKADPRFQYEADEHKALEVFRNFSLPNKDFSDLIGFLATGPRQIELAQFSHDARARYLRDLEALAKDFAAGKITSADAKPEIMGLLARWAHESGLHDAFEKRIRRIARDANRIPDRAREVRK